MASPSAWTAGFSMSNASASSGQISLLGGMYQIMVLATFNAGHVTLMQLGPDGTTFLSVTDDFVANGGDTIYLPSGIYQVIIAGATGVYLQLTRIQL